MSQFSSPVALALAAALALSLPALAEDAPAPAPAGAATAGSAAPGLETVLATVNGTEITLGHVLAMRGSLPPQYLQLPDDVLFPGLVEQLIQQTALAQERAKAASQTDTLTLEVNRRAYLAAAVLDTVAEGAVTEAAVKAAYDAKYVAAEPSREYHAAHILVETEEEAKAAKAEIDGGKDFAEIAKARSKDGTAANGGDLGWFPLSAMVEPFGQAVAKLKAGEVSAPVQSPFGWHVIKLFEDRLAKAPSIDSVREELAGELRQKAVEAHVKALLEGAKVEKSYEGIDPAVLRDETLLPK